MLKKQVIISLTPMCSWSGCVKLVVLALSHSLQYAFDLGGRPARRCDRRSGSSVHPVLEVLELAVRQHGGDDVASRGRRLGEAAVEEHVGVAGRAICGLGVEDLSDGPGGGGDGADDAVVGGVRVVGGAEEARKLCVGGLE